MNFLRGNNDITKYEGTFVIFLKFMMGMFEIAPIKYNIVWKIL